MPPKEASLPFLIGAKNFNSVPFTSLIIAIKRNGNAYYTILKPVFTTLQRGGDEQNY